MALDGTSMATIAAYFGVNRQEFMGAFHEVWSAGNAELRGVIAQNSVWYGRKSNIPAANIWLGKSKGGLAESKSVDVEADDDSEVTLNVSIVRKQEQSEDE